MFIKKLLSFAILTLCSFNLFAEQTPTISQNELVKLLAQPHSTNFIVLDVRTPKEYNNGHIKGAINISHNTITQNFSLLESHKDKMIVVHCRSGSRAVSAERALKENGVTNIRHLEGDMLGWVAAKLPLVTQ